MNENLTLPEYDKLFISKQKLGSVTINNFWLITLFEFLVFSREKTNLLDI